MVFPSDSSNYKISYRDGERVSKDGEITPPPPPSNTHSAKDFRRILEREREKKSATSKAAKEDEADDNLIADNSTEIDSSGGDLASVQDKITPFPYPKKTSNKDQNSSKELEDAATGDIEFYTPVGKGEGDVSILPVFPQPVSKVKVKSEETVVIDSDLLQELTDSFKANIETKSSTTAKAGKTIDPSDEKDITDLDAIVALPQPTIQPIKQAQDTLTPDTKDKVQAPVNDDLVAITVPKSGVKIKTDQDIPHLIPSADLIKRSNSGEQTNVESPFTLFATQSRSTQRGDGLNAQVGSNTSFTSKDVSAAGKGRVSAFSTDEEFDAHVTVNPLGSPPPVAANASVAETPKTGPVLTTEDIDNIVNQIEKLYTVSVQGKSETVIILKQPPLFDGAHVVIKSSAHAPNEFNLSFENLNQTAQRLIDSNANQARLAAALDDKGFTVHIITATTLIETYDVKSNQSQGNRSNDQGNRGGDDNQQSEQQNKKKQR